MRFWYTADFTSYAGLIRKTILMKQDKVFFPAEFRLLKYWTVMDWWKVGL